VDNFSVHLDPNLDGLTGYSFRVSAANVQGDTYFYNDDQRERRRPFQQFDRIEHARIAPLSLLGRVVTHVSGFSRVSH
jgi:hypothetical protein